MNKNKIKKGFCGLLQEPRESTNQSSWRKLTPVSRCTYSVVNKRTPVQPTAGWWCTDHLSASERTTPVRRPWCWAARASAHNNNIVCYWWTHTHIHTRAHTHTRIHIPTYTHTHSQTHTHTHARARARARPHAHTLTQHHTRARALT